MTMHPGTSSRAALAALGILAAASPPTTALAQAAPLPIVPLTTVGSNGSGYLADPQPVHLSAPLAGRIQLLSGTTRAVIACAYPLKPRCFDWTAITVDAGTLRNPIARAGATITNIQNIDIFQDAGGTWHAAVGIGIHTLQHPGHWTLVTHAHPVGPATPGTVPTAWAADTLLAGSLSDPAAGNYDGKYYEDDGRLYLLYVRNSVPEPALRNEIVIQPMRSPTEPAPGGPSVLLSPGDRFGPLNSENYADTPAKLVEAPFITRIGNKYALVYSTGAYLTAGYKAGVAWSDTLLPPAGGRYRKVLQNDPGDIWHTPHRIEVRYLLQSERPRWPNFTLPQVVAPGVAAAVESPTGTWRLFFNGFAPNDMPVGNNGQVEGPHRRPYAMRLSVSVPQDETVAAATNDDLARWMKPAP